MTLSIDWTAAEKQATTKGSNDVVFVKASICPLNVIPVQALQKFEQVFDANTKRARRPQPGEKSQTRFAFYGVNAEGEAAVYITGPQIVGGIASVMKTASKFGATVAGVKITATGSGMSTEYKVELDAALTQRATASPPVLPADIRPLGTVIAALLGEGGTANVGTRIQDDPY